MVSLSKLFLINHQKSDEKCSTWKWTGINVLWSCLMSHKEKKMDSLKIAGACLQLYRPLHTRCVVVKWQEDAKCSEAKLISKPFTQATTQFMLETWEKSIDKKVLTSRRIWGTPVLQNRDRDGKFHLLIEDLKLHHSCWMLVGQFEAFL